jgi:hypothetical protein
MPPILYQNDWLSVLWILAMIAAVVSGYRLRIIE